MYNETSSKVLKTASIINIITGILAIIIGGFGVGLGSMINSGAMQATPELANAVSSLGVASSQVGLAVMAISIIPMIGGILELIMGVLGTKASKDSSRIKPVFVLGTINLILVTIGTGLAIFQGTFTAFTFLTAAVSVAYFWAANDINRATNAAPIAA